MASVARCTGTAPQASTGGTPVGLRARWVTLVDVWVVSGGAACTRFVPGAPRAWHDLSRCTRIRGALARLRVSSPTDSAGGAYAPASRHGIGSRTTDDFSTGGRWVRYPHRQYHFAEHLHD